MTGAQAVRLPETREGMEELIHLTLTLALYPAEVATIFGLLTEELAKPDGDTAAVAALVKRWRQGIGVAAAFGARAQAMILVPGAANDGGTIQ